MDFYNLYNHGFARVAACTLPIRMVQPLANAEAARTDVQLQAAPLQAQLVTDPRPLEEQTDVLDALDRVVRGDSTGAGNSPSTHPTDGRH